jgi:hypothetical protein
MPRDNRVGGDAGVGVINITPAHREHGVNDVVGVFREVIFERGQELRIAADFGQGRTMKFDFFHQVVRYIEFCCGDGDAVAATGQGLSEVDGVALRAAAGGVGFENDEEDVHAWKAKGVGREDQSKIGMTYSLPAGAGQGRGRMKTFYATDSACLSTIAGKPPLPNPPPVGEGTRGAMGHSLGCRLNYAGRFMFNFPTSEFHVLPEFQPAFRELGLDAATLFNHPAIRVWRKLPDRENATLDVEGNGQRVRLHVKRYPPARGAPMGDIEVAGHRALIGANIPTARLVAWGTNLDRSSFTIFEDLAGYLPADKLIESGVAFSQLLGPTANLAAKLHAANLHHRDLYLCHFFAKSADGQVDLKLIDVARVARLGRWFRYRWIKKDLAQFWYSTMALGVTDIERDEWLTRYAEQSPWQFMQLKPSVRRKARWIERHDVALREAQPSRNISIPAN